MSDIISIDNISNGLETGSLKYDNGSILFVTDEYIQEIPIDLISDVHFIPSSDRKISFYINIFILSLLLLSIPLLTISYLSLQAGTPPMIPVLAWFSLFTVTIIFMICFVLSFILSHMTPKLVIETEDGEKHEFKYTYVLFSYMN